MIDVVANHMAYDSTAENVNYTKLNPFNEESYFHSVCWIDDYNNQTQVELVRLAFLFHDFLLLVTNIR